MTIHGGMVLDWVACLDKRSGSSLICLCNIWSLKIDCSAGSANLRQGQNLNQKWSGSPDVCQLSGSVHFLNSVIMNRLKLHKKRVMADLGQHFFSDRVVNKWNTLSEDTGRIPMSVFRRLISYARVTRWPPVFFPMEHLPAVSGWKHGR